MTTFTDDEAGTVAHRLSNSNDRIENRYLLSGGIVSSVVAARRLAANKLLAAVGRHIPTAVWTQPPSPVEFPSARRAAAPALTKLLNGRCREPVGSASISDQCHAPCPDLPKVL